MDKPLMQMGGGGMDTALDTISRDGIDKAFDTIRMERDGYGPWYN